MTTEQQQAEEFIDLFSDPTENNKHIQRTKAIWKSLHCVENIMVGIKQPDNYWVGVRDYLIRLI